MAKKSTGAAAAKEAARVASEGRNSKEGRTGGGRRKILSFSTLVVVILVLGTLLVVFARITRDVSAQPRQNEDHWHSAYGVWDCAANNGTGAFMPPFQSTDDDVGIHSHQDGVIHIHPWFDSASGRSATLEHFFEAMRVSVSEEAIVLPNGTRLEAGVECDGKPSVITVRRWRDLNNLNRDSVVYEEKFNNVRFINTGEAFVISRAASGSDVPTPPNAHVNSALQSTPGLQSRPPLEAEADTSAGATENP